MRIHTARKVDSDSYTADSRDEISGCANTPIAFCGTEIPATSGRGQALLVVLLVAAGALLIGRRGRPVA